jgi:hypothetical protein
MLPKEAVLEYRQIYKAKCGIELSFEEAGRRADNFIRLIALIIDGPTKPAGDYQARKDQK